jgi:hypothetical protein
MPQPKLTPEIVAAAIAGFEQQKNAIDDQISELRELLNGSSKVAAAVETGSPAPKRRKFSAASRRKMAAAQKARWAEINKSKASKSESADSSKPKRKVSRAARAKMAAAQKARWAAKKVAV